MFQQLTPNQLRLESVLCKLILCNLLFVSAFYQVSAQEKNLTVANWTMISHASTPLVQDGIDKPQDALSLLNDFLLSLTALKTDIKFNKGEGRVDTVAVDTSYWLEAECAEIGANWLTRNDLLASNLQYVYVLGKRFNSLHLPPTDLADNKIIFNVNIAQAAEYHLFARLKAPNAFDDSFWVRINGGSWIEWSEGTQTGAAFAWKKLPGGAFNLNSGNNVIEFSYRENGTGLDKIVLSTQDTVPMGRGVAAINCDSLAPVPDADGVVRFTLVDATTHADILEITEGTVLDLSELPSDINVRANTNPASVGSVVFELSGATTRRQVETVGLYTLFGDNNGDYQPGTFNVGNHQLRATAYTERSGGGTAYPAYTVNFSVISNSGLADDHNNDYNNVNNNLVDINTTLNKSGITLYPNPVHQEVQLKASFLLPNERFLAEVLDLHGRVVQSFQGQAQEMEQAYPLELNNLAPGVYLVRVVQGKTQQTEKLIVK
ncbi:MAG: T9SS type A sorting domain-containing protein [Saprospiraceae bacterium]